MTLVQSTPSAKTPPERVCKPPLVHQAWQAAVKQGDINAEDIKVLADDKIFKHKIRLAARAQGKTGKPQKIPGLVHSAG